MTHWAFPLLFGVLMEAALRGLAAAGVLWLGLRVLRVENVPAQKAAWGLVLAAAMAMPALMRWNWMPGWAALRVPSPAWLQAMEGEKNEPTVRQTASSAAAAAGWSESGAPELSEEAARFPAPGISYSEFDGSAENASSTASAAVATPVTQTSPQVQTGRATTDGGGWNRVRWPELGWGVYLAVGAALLMRLLMGVVASARLWMGARPVAGELGGGAAVRWSERILSPVNVGSGIVLPADYSTWDEEKLRVVLAHEGAHVRQHDYYLQLLAGLYAAVIWFSPLGWWLKRKLSELGEAISDRAGLEAAASRTAYAELLLEFAAMPRPTFTGVAMAHSSNLPGRIERLLNESSYSRSFAGGRRALLALALVPAAVIAATAMVRVQAAEVPQAVQAPAVNNPAAADQSSRAGQSNPAETTVENEGQETAATPAPAAAPASAPPPAPDEAPAAEVPPLPPTPPVRVVGPGAEAAPAAPLPPEGQDQSVPPAPPMPPGPGLDAFNRNRDRFSRGDDYAIVGGEGQPVRRMGVWGPEREEDFEKAKKMTKGPFLWFHHDGKDYIVDDPAIVADIEAQHDSMDELNSQMKELGKQMRDAGQQEREAARKLQTAEIRLPDLSKEMAEASAAMNELKAQNGGLVNEQQLGELERRIGEVESRLGAVQGKMISAEVQAQMGKMEFEMKPFEAQMSKLGTEMGVKGTEADQKAREMMDQSLKDGKARPVK